MTGKEIFERAMDLCALRAAEDSLPADTLDLQARSVGLLNVLMGELHGLNERLMGMERPVAHVYGLEETVGLCEPICTCVLPYRLAALLIAEEDSELYTVLQSHAKEAKRSLLADGKTRRHGIVEVYG